MGTELYPDNQSGNRHVELQVGWRIGWAHRGHRARWRNWACRSNRIWSGWRVRVNRADRAIRYEWHEWGHRSHGAGRCDGRDWRRDHWGDRSDGRDRACRRCSPDEYIFY